MHVSDLKNKYRLDMDNTRKEFFLMLLIFINATQI